MYSVTPALPAGLTIDPTTGSIVGIPQTLTAATDYAIMATGTDVQFSTVTIDTQLDVLTTVLSFVSAGTTAAPVGVPIAVTLTTIDPTLSQFTFGGLPVSFSVDNSAGGDGVVSAVTDNLDGTYTVNFTGMLLGDATVTASIGGTAIFSSWTFTVGVGPPAQLVFTTQPSATTQSATAFGVQPIIELRDAGGNLCTGATDNVTLAIGNNAGTPAGILGGTTTVAAVGGVATFAGLSIDKIGVGYTLRASSGVVPTTDSAPLDITIGPMSAAVSTFVSDVPSLPGDGVTVANLTATILDAGGNPISGKDVQVTSSRGGSDVINPVGIVTTDASGVATFTVSSLLLGPGVFTATNMTDALAVTATPTVTFTPGGVSATLSTVVPSVTTATADGLPTTTVTVTLLDNLSNPVPGKTVTLTSARGPLDIIAPASGVSDGAGQVIFTISSTTAGGAQLTATDTTDAIPLVSQPTVTFLPGPASATVSTLSASPTTLLADGSMQSTITITLLDQFSNPTPTKVVLLSSSRGASDTISPPIAISDAAGVVTFTVSSAIVGNSTITAQDITDGVTLLQTAALTFTPGAISDTLSTVVAVPTTQVADNITPSVVTVTIRDVFSNVVAGRTVSLASDRPGSDTITPASAVTNAAGIATFAVRSNLAGVSTYTATETGTPVVIAQQPTVAYAAGMTDATNSTVVLTPTSIAADGSTIGITVTLLDAFMNPVPGKSVSVSSSRGGTDTIVNIVGTSDGSGVATFTIASTTIGAAILTIQDTTDMVTLATMPTATFTAPPVSPTLSTVVPAPAAVLADGLTQSTVTVTLLDTMSNPVAGKVVTLASSRGATDTIGVLSGTTDGAGQATFTVVSTTSGLATLSATDVTDAIPITNTGALTFTAGPADPTLSTVSPSVTSVAADGVATTTVTVTLRDVNGNPVPATPVQLTSTGVATTITPAIPTNTDALGVVTFTVASVTIGTATLTATETATPTPITSSNPVITFTVGPVSPTVSTVVPSTLTNPADGATPVTFTITLMDSVSNPVAGKTVTLTSSRGATDTITPASGVSDGAGVVTFTVTSATSGSPQFTATDTTDAIPLSTQPTINFTAGVVSPTVSSISATPTTLAGDNTVTSAVTVTLRDALGNPVPLKVVTLATTRAGNDTLNTISGTTDALGVATFTVSSNLVGTSIISATDFTDAIPITPTVSLTFVPGAVNATTSTIAALPAALAADGITPSTITVTLRDLTGNAVPGRVVTISSDRGATDTITTLVGTTNALGQATFSVTSTTTGIATISAIGDSIPLVSTATVTFNPGITNAAMSTVSSSAPFVAANGIAFTTVVVTCRDLIGTPVPGSVVSLVSSRGGSDSIVIVTGTTDGLGQATFEVSSVIAGASTFTATDTTNGITITQTGSTTFTAGTVDAANSTVIATGPTTVTADGVMTIPVRVTLKDNLMNNVMGQLVTLTSSRGAADTISPALAASDLNGEANFTIRSTVAGNSIFNATANPGSIAITDNETGTFAPGPTSASVSSVNAAPMTVIADGATPTTITITLRDAQGNVKPGQNVSIASSRAGLDTILPATTGTTDLAGVIAFTVTSATAGSSTFTIDDTTDLITVAAMPVVSFVPGLTDAGTSTVLAAPASVKADNSTTATVTVTLRDSTSNLVSGKTVTLASDRVEDVISPASAVSDGSGVATFTVHSPRLGLATLTADVTTDTVTITQQGTVTFTASRLIVSGVGSPINADTLTDVTVTAQDQLGNTDTTYTGTIQFTSSDAGATLPANYLFTGPDAGTYTFTMATKFITSGAQTLTASDTVDPTITGFQGFTVNEIAPSALAYLDPNPTYVVLSTIVPNTATYSGGLVTNFSIAPPLPAGLSIHPTTGTISGTPTIAVPLATYTITATNGAGFTTATVDLSTDFDCSTSPGAMTNLPYAAGAGTPGNPYLLCSADQINQIGLNPADWGASFRMMDNISLAAYDASTAPLTLALIGTGTYTLSPATFIAGTPFTGTFDGNGFTLSTLTIREGLTANAAGLFRYTDGATITNLTLSGVDVEGSAFLGGLIGYARRTTITNVTVSGSIRDTSANAATQYAGGIAGFLDGSGAGNTSSVTGSVANVNVTGNDSVGAVAGRNDATSGGTATISTTNSAGNIVAVGGSSGWTFGGLVGQNIAGTGTATITTCVSAATVSSFGRFTGGLVGANSSSAGGNSTITSSDATGNVTVVSNGVQHVGGLIGTNSGANSQVISSTASGAVNVSGTAVSFVGGLMGSNTPSAAGSTAVSQSSATGAVTVTGINANSVGGLIGLNAGSSAGANANVTRSHSTGAVQINSAGGNRVGGLIGSNLAGSGMGAGTSTITRSYSTSTVTFGAGPAASTFAGGLVGQNVNAAITDAYARGNITTPSGSSIGGLMGTNIAGTITNTYASGSVTGTTNVGGFLGSDVGGIYTSNYWDSTITATGVGSGLVAGTFGLSTASMQLAPSFGGWDFTTIWTAPGGAYLILQ